MTREERIAELQEQIEAGRERVRQRQEQRERDPSAAQKTHERPPPRATQTGPVGSAGCAATWTTSAQSSPRPWAKSARM
jgi:hypothetical protein